MKEKIETIPISNFCRKNKLSVVKLKNLIKRKIIKDGVHCIIDEKLHTKYIKIFSVREDEILEIYKEHKYISYYSKGRPEHIGTIMIERKNEDN